jgi:hypothetical protein
MIYDNLIGTAGYTYNHRTRKLLRADSQSIYPALAMTCKHIAAELPMYAFRNRPITLQTVYSNELRVRARRFDELIYGQCRIEASKIESLRDHITDDIYEEALR